jgi:PSP1 C-terminal conserved region
VTSVDASEDLPEGTILRAVTEQDRMLADRLERNRLDALRDCELRLKEHGLQVVLLDAELTFDGRSLFFSTPELDGIVAELTDAYDRHVQFRRFSETLENGCGPGCGTKSKSGCGTSGGCTSCSLSGGCGTNKSK